MHGYRRTVTSNVIGRHPNGSCASRRRTVSHAAPCSPQRWHQSSRSRTRQAITARIRLEALPEHDEAEIVRASEGRQVRVSEGSLRHVLVFRVGA